MTASDGSEAKLANTINIAFAVSKDSMEVRLDVICAPAEPGVEVNVALVVAALQQQHIIYGIDETKIADVLALHATGAAVNTVVIATGTPPQPGKDGELQWSESRIADANFVVKAGDVIAHYIHAREGVAGMDVYGNPVAAAAGRNGFPAVGSGIDTIKQDDCEEYRAQHLGSVMVDDGPDTTTSIHLESALSVTEDGMEATMPLYALTSSQNQITVDDVVQVLEKSGVKHGIDQTAIVDALKRAQGGVPQTAIVARGTPPQAGKDAKLVISHKENNAGEELSDGRIDFHERNYPWNVSAGETLGYLLEAKPAIEGIPVWGGTIEVAPPKDIELELIGAHKAENGKLVADIDGALIMRGHTIEIVDLLAIKGDVGPQTGNVHSKVPVHVSGHIEPGFSVESQQDIIIDKNVEDATVRAGKDLVIKGGIRGMHSNIFSPGKVDAGFIENAEVFVNGNIMVKESVINSKVASNSQIVIGSKTAKHGALMGGELIAHSLIQARVLGTPAYTKTIVRVGLPQELRRELNALMQEIDTKQAELAKLDQLENHLKANPAAMKADMAAKISATRQVLTQALDKLQLKHEEFSQQLANADNAKVVVTKTVYPGVTIYINDVSLEVKQEHGCGAFVLRSGRIEFMPGAVK